MSVALKGRVMLILEEGRREGTNKVNKAWRAVVARARAVERACRDNAGLARYPISDPPDGSSVIGILQTAGLRKPQASASHDKDTQAL